MVVLSVAAADLRVLYAARRLLLDTPAVPVARGLSRVGEHAWGWLAMAALGATCSRRDRARWAEAALLVLAAHAAGAGVKRLVRRPRPELADLPALVATASRLSFPSVHATSTTAAAVLFAPLVPGGPAAGVAVAGAMAVSRVLLGVHYPSDVLAGTALGAGVSVIGRRMARLRPDPPVVS